MNDTWGQDEFERDWLDVLAWSASSSRPVGEFQASSFSEDDRYTPSGMFMRGHKMWCRLVCFSPRGDAIRGDFGTSTCRIPHTYFGERPFHALGWIDPWQVREASLCAIIFR
jgi:hypothetical protein